MDFLKPWAQEVNLEWTDDAEMLVHPQVRQLYADRISTVSPTYAKEIQTPEQGCGLDGLLRARSGVLSGILNAVDESVWNPARDPLIPFAFDATDSAGKLRCMLVNTAR